MLTMSITKTNQHKKCLQKPKSEVSHPHLTPARAAKSREISVAPLGWPVPCAPRGYWWEPSEGHLAGASPGDGAGGGERQVTQEPSQLWQVRPGASPGESDPNAGACDRGCQPFPPLSPFLGCCSGSVPQAVPSCLSCCTSSTLSPVPGGIAVPLVTEDRP